MPMVLSTGVIAQLQNFHPAWVSQQFIEQNRCENRCHYVKLLKKSLQL